MFEFVNAMSWINSVDQALRRGFFHYYCLFCFHVFHVSIRFEMKYIVKIYLRCELCELNEVLVWDLGSVITARLFVPYGCQTFLPTNFTEINVCVQIWWSISSFRWVSMIKIPQNMRFASVGKQYNHFNRIERCECVCGIRTFDQLESFQFWKKCFIVRHLPFETKQLLKRNSCECVRKIVRQFYWNEKMASLIIDHTSMLFQSIIFKTLVRPWIFELRSV